MDRRTLLARLGGLAAVGIAGCIGDNPGSGPSTGTGDPPDNSDTDTPTGTVEDTATATATDYPSDGEPDTVTTPPHDAPFPPGRDDVDRVVWFREVSNPDERLFLEHSASSVSLPDAELSFTLRNNTDRLFLTNFYNWALYRWEAGRWHRVAPTEYPEPLMELPAGESHTWSVEFRNDRLSNATFRSQGTEDLTVDAVGGGSYAFACEGWWEDQDETPTYEHKTVAAARFTIEGDQLSLEPSEAVTGSRRDGDTVVVEAENPYGRDSDDDGDPATYVLTRDDEAADPESLITEQVYRHWPLRDGLAHAEENVAEVRVETTTRSTPAFGVHEDRDPAVQYDGRTYRISVDEEAD